MHFLNEGKSTQGSTCFGIYLWNIYYKKAVSSRLCFETWLLKPERYGCARYRLISFALTFHSIQFNLSYVLDLYMLTWPTQVCTSLNSLLIYKKCFLQWSKKCSLILCYRCQCISSTQAWITGIVSIGWHPLAQTNIYEQSPDFICSTY